MYFYVYKSTTIIYFNMTYMVYTTLMLLPTHQAGLKIKLHFTLQVYTEKSGLE